jgi:hypothetical protein
MCCAHPHQYKSRLGLTLGRNAHGALLKRELVIPGLESGNRADHLAESGATSKQTALDRSSSSAETTPTCHRVSDR